MADRGVEGRGAYSRRTCGCIRRRKMSSKKKKKKKGKRRWCAQIQIILKPFSFHVYIGYANEKKRKSLPLFSASATPSRKSKSRLTFLLYPSFSDEVFFFFFFFLPLYTFSCLLLLFLVPKESFPKNLIFGRHVCFSSFRGWTPCLVGSFHSVLVSCNRLFRFVLIAMEKERLRKMNEPAEEEGKTWKGNSRSGFPEER